MFSDDSFFAAFREPSVAQKTLRPFRGHCLDVLWRERSLKVTKITIGENFLNLAQRTFCKPSGNISERFSQICTKVNCGKPSVSGCKGLLVFSKKPQRFFRGYKKSSTDICTKITNRKPSILFCNFQRNLRK